MQVRVPMSQIVPNRWPTGVRKSGMSGHNSSSMVERTGGATNTQNGGTGSNDTKSSKLDDHQGAQLLLLPGIPDEIMLDHICTRLPWKAFYTLSSVSPAWREAIQTHRVHDARIRSQSAESVLVHYHYRPQDDILVVALYSMVDNCCYELPAIPEVEGGISRWSECVALDGKIYVIGLEKECDVDEEEEAVKVYSVVYELDLAGQKQWKQCASMREDRGTFACGVMDGKIYVFGGGSPRGPVHGSEVYDPVANVWSPIKPMALLRFAGHHIATLGKELAVYGGVYDKTAQYAKEHSFNNHGQAGYGCTTENALYLEVYHPLKDEWRVVDPFLRQHHRTRTVFEARENLYMMSERGIGVFDNESHSWKALQKNSFAVLGTEESITVDPSVVAFVNDDELVARVGWHRKGWHWNDDLRPHGNCLVQGRGFRSESKEITWQILATCFCDFKDVMYIMQV